MHAPQLEKTRPPRRITFITIRSFRNGSFGWVHANFPTRGNFKTNINAKFKHSINNLIFNNIVIKTLMTLVLAAVFLTNENKESEAEEAEIEPIEVVVEIA